MAEAFVKTMKRGYVSVNPVPDGPAELEQLVKWFDDYNTVHPHSALGYRSPDELTCQLSRGQLQQQLVRS